MQVAKRLHLENPHSTKISPQEEVLPCRGFMLKLVSEHTLTQGPPGSVCLQADPVSDPCYPPGLEAEVWVSCKPAETVPAPDNWGRWQGNKTGRKKSNADSSLSAEARDTNPPQARQLDHEGNQHEWVQHQSPDGKTAGRRMMEQRQGRRQ